MRMNGESDQAFTAVDKRADQHLSSTSEAIVKAEQAVERRFEAVNEFRAQLNDQAIRFLTRDEYEAKHSALHDRVEDHAKRAENMASRIEERFRIIELQMTAQFERDAGRTKGIGDSWKYSTAMLGAVATLLAIYTITRGQ